MFINSTYNGDYFLWYKTVFSYKQKFYIVNRIISILFVWEICVHTYMYAKNIFYIRYTEYPIMVVWVSWGGRLICKLSWHLWRRFLSLRLLINVLYLSTRFVSYVANLLRDIIDSEFANFNTIYCAEISHWIQLF